VTFKKHFKRAVNGLTLTMPDGWMHLSDHPRYYLSTANAGGLTWAAKVNMVLRQCRVSNKQRFNVLSAIVSRPITTTKELTVAESAAIWNSRNNPNLLSFIKEVIDDNTESA
jgi:hypothetical protein